MYKFLLYIDLVFKTNALFSSTLSPLLFIDRPLDFIQGILLRTRIGPWK